MTVQTYFLRLEIVRKTTSLTPSLRHPVLLDPDSLQRAEMLRLR